MSLRHDAGPLLPLLLALGCSTPDTRTLDLPQRADGSPSGSELVEELRDLDLETREDRVDQEIARGNVPSWLRRLHPVQLTGFVGGQRRTITIWVTPDYLAVGSNVDFLRIPLSPGAANRIGTLTRTVLPTPAMVDAIWRTATVRLGPVPIPPSRFMTTVPVFQDHQNKVQLQRDRARAPPGALVAGHKKDVVTTPKMVDHPGHVAIYGWHYLTGEPIQRLYLGHTDDWVDYSHGIRLVWDSVDVDGELRAIRDVLADPGIAPVLSPEGPIPIP